MRNFAGTFVAFARTAARCLYDIPFYRALRHKPLREALGHVAVTALLVWMVPFAVAFFFTVRGALAEADQFLRKNVPPGTTFEMKDGVFTNDLAAPIVLKQEGQVFIINASNTDLTLAEGETGLAVRREELVQKSSTERTETVSFKAARDFSFTREEADEWLGRGAFWVILIGSLAVFAAAALGLAIWYGLTILAHAGAAWLVLKAFKRPQPFDRAAVLAGYALTLPVLAGALAFWSGIDLGLVPMLLYWVLLAFIIRDVLKGSEKELNFATTENDRRPDAPERGEEKGGEPRPRA